MKWTNSKFPDSANYLQEILNSWKGTPYLEGAQKKKSGVDCVRFCCGVADEFLGQKPVPIESLPADTAFHNKKLALEAMRKLKRLYEPLITITNGIYQPGNLLVTGPKNGGPGHLMIVGPEPNTIWHTLVSQGVVKTGFSVPSGHKLFTAYRF